MSTGASTNQPSLTKHKHLKRSVAGLYLLFRSSFCVLNRHNLPTFVLLISCFLSGKNQTISYNLCNHINAHEREQ